MGTAPATRRPLLHSGWGAAPCAGAAAPTGPRCSSPATASATPETPARNVQAKGIRYRPKAYCTRDHSHSSPSPGSEQLQSADESMVKQPRHLLPALYHQPQGSRGYGHAGSYHSGRIILQLHVEVIAHDLVDVHLQVISIVLCESPRCHASCKGNDPGRPAFSAFFSLHSTDCYTMTSCRQYQDTQATCVVVKPAQHVAYQGICLGGAVWPTPTLQASSSTLACCRLQGAIHCLTTWLAPVHVTYPICLHLPHSGQDQRIGRHPHLIDGQLQRRPPAEDDGCALLEPWARRRRQAELRRCRSAPSRGCMQHTPS
jgi:hypothetical protein